MKLASLQHQVCLLLLHQVTASSQKWLVARPFRIVLGDLTSEVAAQGGCGERTSLTANGFVLDSCSALRSCSMYSITMKMSSSLLPTTTCTHLGSSVLDRRVVGLVGSSVHPTHERKIASRQHRMQSCLYFLTGAEKSEPI